MKKCIRTILVALPAALATPAPAGTSITTIVSSTKYERILPGHSSFYSFDSFVLGSVATAGFCTSGDTPTRIRECAAFLANMTHETGGGRLVAEQTKNRCPEYCDANQADACAPTPGKSYYGRGWLQVSWNYNYCAASTHLYGDDGSTLVRDPDILERDPAVSLRASLWYWMTQKGPGTMSSHDCIVTNAGFGCTIRAINGSLECDGGNPEQVKSRVDNYMRTLSILGDGAVKPVGRDEC